MSVHQYDQRCVVCDWSGSIVAEPEVCPPCPQCGGATERLWVTPPQIVDDTLPGGPRWFDNLGHTPVWIETKAQLQTELDKRGLKLRETDNYNRNDKSPWATPSRYRAGVLIDPYLEALAREVLAPRVPLVRVRDEFTLRAGDVEVVLNLEEAVRSLGYVMALRCQYCESAVVGDNSRLSNIWRMTCDCRRLSYGDPADADRRASAEAGSGSDLGGR